MDYKERVYKEFKVSGRPFYSIDKSQEPTDEEKKIILEIFDQKLKLSVQQHKGLAELRKKWDQYIREQQSKGKLSPD